MDGQTGGQGETSIPRFQLRWSGGYNKSALVHAMGLQRTGKMPLWLEQWWASSQDSLLIHMSAAGFSELIKQQCVSCIDWQKQGQHISYQECPFFWSQQDTSWATREKQKYTKLEQLERLRSEKNPRCPMITQTINSYWIPFIQSQNYIVLRTGGIITNPWIYHSEWLNLTACLGTVDSEVHIVHISRVIIAYTLDSLSSLTEITHNLQATIYFKKKDIKQETQKSEGTH